jgi:hypothetical protein|tara:strand:- start:752 stop:1300 length:549 start_codon:yes stop_codon:yes gene_type:complete
MFEHLTIHPKIIVTGPQRSGTNICAQMIAHDTGHTFVTAQAVGIANLDMLTTNLKSSVASVIHGPAFSRYVHELDVFVVTMLRNVQDIYLSQERIRWYGGEEELARYRDCPIWKEIQEAFTLEDPDRSVASVKYYFWHQYQKQRCAYLEVEYEGLTEHPLWVPKELRSDFATHQTSLDWKPY